MSLAATTHRASRKKRYAPKRSFAFSDIPRLLREADEQLAKPAHPLSERVDGVGQCVARFVLHLDQCKDRANARDKATAWQHAKHKSNVRQWMKAQTSGQRTTPVPGRPLVRCIRFSAKAPDRLTQWSKVPVDCLLPPRKRAGKVIPGLCFIADDSPDKAHVVQFWEPAPVNGGFVVVECWTGEVTF